MTEGAALPLF